ncbi:MAG: hypothetical protein Q8K85_24540 [Hyphomicrobium sp.]|nr:hypothetical protein [Hyphomicrobium sp.]
MPGGDGWRRAAGEAAMTVAGIFDALFVNQLFRTNERGATIFYPNGLMARGYIVPPEREASVRGGLRRLVLLAFAGAMMLAVVLPRMLEAWLGFTLPLGWFLGYAIIALVIGIAAIIHFLSRLTVGLEPAPTR